MSQEFTGNLGQSNSRCAGEWHRCNLFVSASSKSKFYKALHKRLIEKLEKHDTGGKLKWVIENGYKIEDRWLASVETC